MTSNLISFGNDHQKVKLAADKSVIGFFEIDVGLSNSTSSDFEGMRIAAMQDMNNDKLIDLITVNSASDLITVYYFNSATN